MNDALVNADMSAESLVGQVADEFLRRQEAGERPDVEEYAARYPQAAELIRKALTTLNALDAPLGQGESVTRTLGDFHILREVGRGGMGVVYEANQISLGRRVALKVLPFAAMLDPRHLQRFQNEARAAASLEHPHIVSVYAVGCERGVHFYAMKFIDGRTVAEVIAAQSPSEPQPSGRGAGPVDHSPGCGTTPIAKAKTKAISSEAAFYRQVAEWGIQASQALEHAHSLGIVHRDVKPANLIVDSRGDLWVTDFGLARTAANAGLTITGDLLGTLRYASPEQALGKRHLVDHRTDVYSLGVTLYELLTLRPAVDGSDQQELLHKIANEEPRAPRQCNAEIPVDLETIVLKALSKEPVERYATAGELASDLRQFLEHRPILARRPTAWHRAAKWAGRHQGVVLAAVAGLCVALAVLGVSTWRIGVSEAEARWHRDRAEEQARAAREAAAKLVLEKAQGLCDQGEIGQGILWLAHGLEIAVQADAADLEHVFRLNLALWQPKLSTLRSCLRHPGRVLEVAFLDGSTLATVCDDEQARLWNLSTGQARHLQFSGLPGVRHLALSADGRMLALGCTVNRLTKEDPSWRIQPDPNVWEAHREPPGKILLWNVQEGRLHDRTVSPPRPIHRLCLSGDGRLLVASSWEKLILWDVPACDTRTTVPKMSENEGLDDSPRPSNTVWALAASPDGRTLLTGGRLDNQARFWEVASGKEVGPALQHSHSVTAVAISSDGRLVLTGSGDNVARLWDVGTRKRIGPELLHHGIIEAAAFSPDGQTVLTGSHDKLARLWRTDTGKPLGQPLQHGGFVQAVACSRDGRLVATAAWDGVARVWEMPRDRPTTPSFHHKGGVRAARFSPDGRLVATGGEDRMVRLWDAATGRPVGPPLLHPHAVRGISFVDGQRVFTATGQFGGCLWESATGRVIREEPEAAFPLGAFHTNGPFGVAVKRDAVGGNDSAWITNTATGERLGNPFPAQEIGRGFQFSPCGRWFLTVSDGGTTQVRRLDTREPTGVVFAHKEAVMHATFSPDGEVIWTVTSDGVVRSWSAKTGEHVRPPVVDPDGAGSESLFSPDTRLVLTLRGDGTARIRDVRTGRPLGPRLPHWGPVSATSFDPQGRRVVTVLPGGDSAQVWDIPPPTTGSAERLRSWAEVITGLRLDADGVVRSLEAAEWQQRQQRY